MSAEPEQSMRNAGGNHSGHQPGTLQKDGFLKALPLQTNIATVVKQGDTLSPEVIDERLRELQKELVKKANQKAGYDAIADEILRLRDMRKQAEVDSVSQG